MIRYLLSQRLLIYLLAPPVPTLITLYGAWLGRTVFDEKNASAERDLAAASSLQ